MDLIAKPNNFFLISIVVLVYAIAFNTNKAEDEKGIDWVLAKKRTAISCGISSAISSTSTLQPQTTNRKPFLETKHEADHNSSSNGADRQNNCSHLWSASGLLCDNSEHKRRLLKALV
jgi:hypothetical protein